MTPPISSQSPPAADNANGATPRLGWRDTLRAYREPASLRMLALGFSAGLPLLRQGAHDPALPAQNHRPQVVRAVDERITRQRVEDEP